MGRNESKLTRACATAPIMFRADCKFATAEGRNQKAKTNQQCSPRSDGKIHVYPKLKLGNTSYIFFIFCTARP